ncbi:MAG: hypothetical protein GW893_24195, partial [Armatimonadetes bacterium]|nr:hypothetical protein [Armatimonadota bacterium]
MKISWGLTLVVAATLTSGAHAAVSLTTGDKDGNTRYRMDNGRVSLVVDPSKGGVVVSYKDKLGGDVELIPDQSPHGLGIDHFQSQYWPGEMLGAKYEVVDQKNDPKE